ncbi:hypothetical protein VKT23_014156 [Stygiomarasmius scandens]|uniref:SWIM-type domain-containing protein n=1 Tax=Marasmiellus scandens TaxID=2682957 RepID=A0ABR1J641_9AGAR
MIFSVDHDLRHLIPFSDKISLTNPLQAPLEVQDWFQHSTSREAALFMLVSKADPFVFEAPQCKRNPKVFHRATISLDTKANELGYLHKVDEIENDCNCPLVLFRPDKDHQRCIHKAWLNLTDRFDRLEVAPPEILSRRTHTSSTNKVAPPEILSRRTRTSSTNSNPKKRALHHSDDDKQPTFSTSSGNPKKRAMTHSDDEEPVRKKARRSNIAAVTPNAHEVIDLTGEDEDE